MSCYPVRRGPAVTTEHRRHPRRDAEPTPAGEGGASSSDEGEAAEAARRAAEAAEDVAESRGFTLAARVGFAGSGVMHLVIGLIALNIATGGGGEADRSGAVRQVSARPLGDALVWLCFLGCAALTVFLVVQSLSVPRRPKPRQRLKQRLSYLGRAAAFGAIGGSFASVALGGSSGGSGTTQSLSARVLSYPGGALLLGAVGVGIMIAGGYFVWRGVSRGFRKTLWGLPPQPAAALVLGVGLVGYVAKGVALGVLGVLCVQAGLQRDPQESRGLDGALKTLAHQSYGAWLLGAVAVGLMCYGAFLAARARYERM